MLALLLSLALAPLGAAGCAGGLWDRITSDDFKVSSFFNKPNPLVILRDSTDGRDRAEALRALHEPKQHGGTDEEQDVVVEILTKAAWSERQAFCRMAAIQSLRHFKDPRVVEGLKEAYYRAGTYPPEIATILKCQALLALGETAQPAAVEVLVKVLREPPVEGPEQDKQMKMDERIAAARALGHFKQYQATEGLLTVLQSEQDVALRDRVTESLQLATGKDIPANYQAWADYLHQPNNPNTAVTEGVKKGKLLEFILTGGK
jgi:hypothetical protein